MTVARWLGWAGLMTLGYGGICLLMAVAQRSFIYFPRPAADPTGQLELPVEGQRVLVAHRPQPGPEALIYFGGNAEDVSLTRAELAALLPDTALYLLHYRGYGGSEGSPSEAALHADAQALYGDVARRHSAVDLAATQPVQRLMLLVPFDSLLAVARGAMRWLPVDLLLRDRWDGAAEAPMVEASTRIVAELVDDLDHDMPILHAAAFRTALLAGSGL